MPQNFKDLYELLINFICGEKKKHFYTEKHITKTCLKKIMIKVRKTVFITISVINGIPYI